MMHKRNLILFPHLKYAFGCPKILITVNYFQVKADWTQTIDISLGPVKSKFMF